MNERTRDETGRDEALWRRVVEQDDREALSELVAEHLDDLRRTARHELTYFVALGDLPPDLITADELVGEVLDRAWRGRKRRPADLELTAWLHGLLFRVVDRMVKKEREQRRFEQLSIEEEVPKEPIIETDDEFYDWYEPEEVMKWEDVIPDNVPTPEMVAEALEEPVLELEPTARRAFILHDALNLSVRTTARVLGISQAEARERIVQARRQVIARAEGRGARAETGHDKGSG